MLRTFLSYFVLIFVPLVSLAIAVAPYWWVRKKWQSGKVAKWQSEKETLLPVTLLPVPFPYLWLAFLIGLVGNVGWWWVVDSIINERISIYFQGANDSGIMFAFFLYSFFLLLTPFLFFKLHYHTFTKQRIIATVLLTILAIALLVGVWIVLFAIAIRGIFYQLN